MGILMDDRLRIDDPTSVHAGDGNDSVGFQIGGTFNGGPGTDSVGLQLGGTFNQD